MVWIIWKVENCSASNRLMIKSSFKWSLNLVILLTYGLNSVPLNIYDSEKSVRPFIDEHLKCKHNWLENDLCAVDKMNEVAF